MLRKIFGLKTDENKNSGYCTTRKILSLSGGPEHMGLMGRKEMHKEFSCGNLW
jgi:hypothetical protein